MSNEETYQPISCDFHDVLESTATRRVPARIVFVDVDGTECQRDARIVDLVTRPEGEFMMLESGESIRHDRIVSVDGVRLADFPD